MVLTILVARIVSAILGWRYFFAGPGIGGSLLALCLAIAVLATYRGGQSRAEHASSVIEGWHN
jgi:predicted MFS family arabinose efflux permease